MNKPKRKNIIKCAFTPCKNKKISGKNNPGDKRFHYFPSNAKRLVSVNKH